jgi:hypothetical protein
MVPELIDPYSIDSCCHSFVMGRCYSKDGIGIAQCDGGFENDSIVSCKSLESPYPDINCFATADVCSLYKQDKVDYIVFLVIGLVMFFLVCCTTLCYNGCLALKYIENEESQDTEDPMVHEEDEENFSVLSLFRSKITGMVQFLYANKRVYDHLSVPHARLQNSHLCCAWVFSIRDDRLYAASFGSNFY